jgi:hypothetical protein
MNLYIHKDNLNLKFIEMESSSFHNIIDYFKLFKVFDLKKL